MRVSSPVLFLGYLVAETLLLYAFWSAFGTVALVSLLLAGFLLGILVMRIAGLSAFGALRRAQSGSTFAVRGADGTEEVVHGPAATQADLERAGRELGKSSLLFVAGMLLAAPGIISDTAGLLLLLPPVRGWIAGRMATRLVANAQSTATITVVTADGSGWTAEQWSSTKGPERPADRSPVIRGEVLPPPRQPEDDH